MDSDWLLNAIVEEVQELKEEIRPNNTAHLEDELEMQRDSGIVIKE